MKILIWLSDATLPGTRCHISAITKEEIPGSALTSSPPPQYTTCLSITQLLAVPHWIIVHHCNFLHSWLFIPYKKIIIIKCIGISSRLSTSVALSFLLILDINISGYYDRGNIVVRLLTSTSIWCMILVIINPLWLCVSSSKDNVRF